MSDDTARAIGAGGSTVEIAGKQCAVRPLSVRELAEVERECLEQYKRTYLKTYSQNLDLLPEPERMPIMREEMTRVARWDKSDLPSKFAYDHKRITVSQALREWIVDKYEPSSNGTPDVARDAESDDGTTDTSSGDVDAPTDAVDAAKIQALSAAALDIGDLTSEQYKEFTNQLPPRVPVDYMGWWITGSYDGMISFVWMCFKDSGVTRDQIAVEMGKNKAMLTAVAREIETLSVPAVGNG